MARMTRKEAADRAIEACTDAIVALRAGEYGQARDFIAAAHGQTATILVTPVNRRKVSEEIQRDPRVSSSLVTGIRILEMFDGSALKGVAGVADPLQIPRSTAHRYLTTLVLLGLLEQPVGAARKYRRPQVGELEEAA